MNNPDQILIWPTTIDDPDGNPIGIGEDTEIPAGGYPLGTAYWAGPGDGATVTIEFDNTDT